jgi:hypothetical protein
MKKKKKKYLNAKKNDQNLKIYLEKQAFRKKINDQKIANHIEKKYWLESIKESNYRQSLRVNYDSVKQQFSLPLYGKLAYTYGFLMKYIFTTLLFTILTVPFIAIFEDVLFPQAYIDADDFLTHFWYFIFLIPLALILSLIPFTKYRKKLIQNYIITNRTLCIIYTNNNTKIIEYRDIISASSLYRGAGSRLFKISYYCQTKKKIVNHFNLFNEIISNFNVYPIKNTNELIASFVQQLMIKNQKASLYGVDFDFYHIDDKTLQLNKKKLFQENLFCWIFFISISSITIFMLIKYS